MVVAFTLAILHIFTTLAKNRISLLPELLTHNGGDNLTGFVLEHHPFLRREEFLLFGEHINNLHLIAHIISLVLGVRNHAGHCGVGDLFAVVVAIAVLPKDVLDLLHGVVSGGIQFEELSHHNCFLLVDD